MNDMAAPSVARRMRRRSYLAEVLVRTARRRGAQVGLLWIAVLTLLGVFAPLLANSHPIIMQTDDGKWSSPMLEHFTPIDIALLVVFFGGIAFYFCKFMAIRWRLVGTFALFMVTWLVGQQLIEPPAPKGLDIYRQMEADGELKYVLRTVIPYSPNDRLFEQRNAQMREPSATHWLGTDANRSDVASRMVHASRVALSIGFIATSIAVVLGIVIGGLMGYFSGTVDILGMRLVEILEAVPSLFLLLMFVAFFPGDTPEVLPGLEISRIFFIMVIIGFTSWSGYARFTRAEFLKLRQQDFIQAAVACGLPLRSVLFRHMLPNGLTPVLVTASFGVASAILAEAVLSFLGLGLVAAPSWGALLNQATGSTGAFSWWLATFPGLAIFLTVFAYTLIGEALRDALDPHIQRAAQM